MIITKNEKTTSYLSVAFYDKNNALAVPSSITYSVYCLTNQIEVRAPTIISPASEIEITLTAEDLKIINPANSFEKRLVTVEAAYGAGDFLKDEFIFQVKNLTRVS